MCNDDPTNHHKCDDFSPAVAWAYHTTANRATGSPPFRSHELLIKVLRHAHTEFNIQDAFNILLGIIQQALVKMFKGNTHESDNLITAYGNLIRLMLVLIDNNLEI